MPLPSPLALMETSSASSSGEGSGGPTSSLNAEAALKERARRSLPLRPPLLTMAGVGMGSRVLSSLDMRFSAAVKVPWERGEGRAGRGTGSEEPDAADGRGDAVDPDELEERLRL